jgi:hypothetical protein
VAAANAISRAVVLPSRASFAIFRRDRASTGCLVGAIRLTVRGTEREGEDEERNGFDLS